MIDDAGNAPKSASTGSLLVIFLTVFIDLLGFGMVLPLLPIYADQFVIDEHGWQIGALMASFSAMQFLFAPLWGNLSDRVGRRPVLMVGLASSCFFYLMFGLATVYGSLAGLFLTRIGAGIAGATIPTAQAYIADTTTAEGRTRGMALIGMAFGLGFTLGPLLGYLAVPDASGRPGPWPGYAASMLSATALLLAIFLLPESNTNRQTAKQRKILDLAALRLAVGQPPLALILMTIFFCIFAFANLETTLSMVLKGSAQNQSSPFNFSWSKICLTFAMIGLVGAMIQGGVVRPLAKRLSERTLTLLGASFQIVGFVAMIVAMSWRLEWGLFIAIAVVASGYSMMQPSLNSLLSQSAAADGQGAMLGLGQSVNSMARILGAALAIPLLRLNLAAPYAVGILLMICCCGLIAAAGKRPGFRG